MKSTVVKVIFGVFISIFLPLEGLSQTHVYKIGCDLRKYNPAIVSHALLNAVKKSVEPVYPSAARSAKADGEVKVQIVVDRFGNVIAACAISGHPFLRNSAEVAAKQWKFKKNFGFKYRPKRKYILASLTFKFKFQ
jgi:TonB family protein